MENELDELLNSETETEGTESTNEESASAPTEEPQYTEAEKAAHARAIRAERKLKELEQQQVKKPQEVNVDKLVDEKLEQRDLEALDLSDSLKTEVKNYAKLHGISIRKAAQSDYILFQIGKESKTDRVENASLNGKSVGITKKNLTDISPEEAMDAFDLKTQEGREAFAEWRRLQDA